MIGKAKHYLPHEVERLLQKKEAKVVAKRVITNTVFARLKAHVSDEKPIEPTETIFTKLKAHAIEARGEK